MLLHWCLIPAAPRPFHTSGPQLRISSAIPFLSLYYLVAIPPLATGCEASSFSLTLWKRVSLSCLPNTVDCPNSSDSSISDSRLREVTNDRQSKYNVYHCWALEQGPLTRKHFLGRCLTLSSEQNLCKIWEVLKPENVNMNPSTCINGQWPMRHSAAI